MMKREIYVYMLIVLATILAACGPSEAELNSTATQVAADIFATQTALAPTATQTFTPTPTVTPSPTPTVTPSPTRTPTITPTPTPHLMAAALTLDDLSSGFSSVSQQEITDMLADMPEDTVAFGYEDEESSQIVMGYLIPLASRLEQIDFDRFLLSDELIDSMAADADPEPLSGLDDIGVSRQGFTFLAESQSDAMRWDFIVFRRGEVAEMVFLAYLEGDEPAMPIKDIARLLDERLKDIQESGF
jgi:hypothetical protein